jgi:5-methylthioadenosine/S-adenosylhomocysteine deaminase
MELKLVNCTAVTADGCDTVIKNAEIHIAGGRIAYIGAAADAPAETAERTLDLKGAVAMPGLVNAHTHLPMNLLRGAADDMPLMRWLNERIWPMEDKMSEEDAYWGTMLACCEMASQGVTAFNDMYFHSRAIYRAVKKSGLTGYISRAIVDTEQQPGEPMLSEALALYRELNGKDGVYVSLAPHAEYTMTKRMFHRLAETAKEYNMRVHIHISETKTEHDACIGRYGKTPTGLLNETGMLDVPVMAAHCVHISDADIALMAEKGVSALSCPRSNLKLASGIARLTALEEAGVNVCLGTDGAASNNALSVYNEMTLAALLQKYLTGDASAIPAAKAVKLATINGAKALGLEAVTGSLEKGKRADIAVVSTEGFAFSPGHDAVADLVYSAQGRDVAYTIAGGRVIYENGRVTFADTAEVLAKAREAALHLIS